MIIDRGFVPFIYIGVNKEPSPFDSIDGALFNVNFLIGIVRKSNIINTHLTTLI